MILPRFQAKPRLHLKHVSLFGAKVFRCMFTLNFRPILEEKLPIFNSNICSTSFLGAYNLFVTQALAHVLNIARSPVVRRLLQ